MLGKIPNRKNVHEVPVLRSRSERTLPQDGAAEFAHNVNQSTQTAQHVQGVYSSEDIENNWSGREDLNLRPHFTEWVRGDSAESQTQAGIRCQPRLA